MSGTKIVNISCQDCGDAVAVFCSAGSRIVAVRCPTCVTKFRERGEEHNRSVQEDEMATFIRLRNEATGVERKRLNRRIAELHHKINQHGGGG